MQESLTNVAKHARAHRVAVRLERSGDDAVLTVSDDGVGMDRRRGRSRARSACAASASASCSSAASSQIASRPGAGHDDRRADPARRARGAGAETA